MHAYFKKKNQTKRDKDHPYIVKRKEHLVFKLFGICETVF